MPLLDVRGLSVAFRTAAGRARAVDDLSFHVAPGETLSIVGESGCGKSLTALALLRLCAPAAAVTGEVLLGGRNLLALGARDMRAVRGRSLAIVFQDPTAALNPVMSVGDQLVEAIRAHARVSPPDARREALRLLDLVHIPDAARRIDDHPHRFSGGMRQRVAIAMAIAARPAVLVADEPTTALDVTIQAQILALLRQLQKELGMALLLITHDLGVVAEMADRVLVMYAGREVESQDVHGLFGAPRHPYTQRLIGAKPRLAASLAGPRARLREIPGMVPLPTEARAGCAFAPRCDLATPRCADALPQLEPFGSGRVACHAAEIAATVASPAAGTACLAGIA